MKKMEGCIFILCIILKCVDLCGKGKYGRRKKEEDEEIREKVGMWRFVSCVQV